MGLNQVSNPFAFLAQGTAAAAAPARIRPVVPPPKLDIGWGSFHQGIWSSVRVLLTWTGVPRKFAIDGFFRECWIERRIPSRAIAAAALWHIFFLIAPFPKFPQTPRHFATFENAELTWSGPINDLPLLDLKSPKPKPSPRGEPEKPPPPKGADAFHPRQHIFTDPVRPTHPRQTLINSAAPMEPPKILPSLPNIVQIQELAGPARPRLRISQEALGKLHPKERRVATVTAAPLPDVPLFEQKPGELPILAAENAPARPKLELNAGAAPRVAPRSQSGEVAPAPEVGAAMPDAAIGNSATFIAISATPGPPAPVAPPQGNLAARVSISPEGKQPGVPGGSPSGISGANGGAGGGVGSGGGMGTGNGGGKNGMDVSISGGNPPANRGLSGLGAAPKISGPSPHTLYTRPDPNPAIEDAPVRTGPPNFASLPPAAPPEQIFASKKVYKLLVNMPNLNSATGSWILNFSELRVNSEGPRVTSSDLSGPAPLRKVDPKYPPTLMKEHVEGEVVLYAVIRRDGSVDSIQLVRGIDDQLDANAMNALSQWRFRPALRQGEAVELEAIVHIPFHAPDIR
ncbi:MAG TPA: TonB family protein [Methylomirabilota bacterium]|nr:TonB family protein [Methylomirabilota bacterium]